VYFKPFDWSTVNWNAVAAISTSIGAIATFLAVIVALWQAKWVNRKKLKLSFGESFALTDGVNTTGEYTVLSVANIGNRKVRITEWGIYINKNRHLWVNEFAADNRILPYDLDIEESITLSIRRQAFIEAIKTEYSKSKRQKLCRVKLYVNDNTGRTYYSYSTKRIKEYCNEK